MAATGRLTFRFRHRVDRLEIADGRVTGISGAVLAADPVQRGQESSREEQGDFNFAAAAVIVSSGGIGGNQELVRRNWPVERLGEPPASMVCGVPAHVDGRMIAITETAGGAVINRDRMWHYTEGVKNHDPIWPGHGIRILPGPRPSGAMRMETASPLPLCRVSIRSVR